MIWCSYSDCSTTKLIVIIIVVVTITSCTSFALSVHVIMSRDVFGQLHIVSSRFAYLTHT